MQEIVIGIDPGSKFSGYTIKSEAHTLLNLQVNAIDDVKGKIEERRLLRRDRRARNAPYRKCRFNRKSKAWTPPSVRARWQQHLNIIKFAQKIYNITDVAVEDIKVKSIKNARRWNVNFSPIEYGKNWFYQAIKDMKLNLFTYQGYDTYEMRKAYGLKKNSRKNKECFYTHCVDSWCLATEVIGGDVKPEHTFVKFLKPLRYHRRKLHEILPKNKGYRRNYGGTFSLGIVRGTLCRHKKHGLVIIGGTSNGRISLHNLYTNKRITQRAKFADLKILTNLKWSIR